LFVGGFRTIFKISYFEEKKNFNIRSA